MSNSSFLGVKEMEYEKAKALAEKIVKEYEKHYDIIKVESIMKVAKPTRFIEFEDLEFKLTQILMRILES